MVINRSRIHAERKVARRMIVAGSDCITRLSTNFNLAVSARLSNVLSGLEMPAGKQFSIAALLLSISFASAGVAVFALPGGLAIYLPILLVLLLSTGVWHFGFGRDRNVKLNRTVAICLTVLLGVGGYFYFMFFGDALAWQKHDRQLMRQRQLIDEISEPQDFENAVLALHSKTFSDVNRAVYTVPVSLTDPDVPSEIKRLNPTQITAHTDCLVISMRPNVAIVAYPRGALMPPLEGYKEISKRVRYYEPE